MIKTMSSLLFLCVLIIPGLAKEYNVNKSQANQVKFISDAPIESFEGVTDRIDGYIVWQGDDPADQSDIYLEVDLNTLDTGIGLRNRHMRENYLETEKYPFTYFKGRITSAVASDSGFTKVNADGKIFIHGVEKAIQVAGKLTPLADGFRIECKFIVKLSDFNIEIPSIMFYKIDENMDMQLDFYISPAK